MSCSYAAPGSRKKHVGSSGSSNNPGDMQNRIDRLEGLVLSLMTNGSQSVGPAAANRTLSMSTSTGDMEYPQDVEIDGVDSRNSSMLRPDGEEAESETEQVAQSFGVMKVFDNKSLYFGEAHWAAVLQDVGNASASSRCADADRMSRSPKSKITLPNIRNNLMNKRKKFRL